MRTHNVFVLVRSLELHSYTQSCLIQFGAALMVIMAHCYLLMLMRSLIPRLCSKTGRLKSPKKAKGPAFIVRVFESTTYTLVQIYRVE